MGTKEHRLTGVHPRRTDHHDLLYDIRLAHNGVDHPREPVFAMLPCLRKECCRGDVEEELGDDDAEDIGRELGPGPRRRLALVMHGRCRRRRRRCRCCRRQRRSGVNDGISSPIVAAVGGADFSRAQSQRQGQTKPRSVFPRTDQARP